MIADLHKNSGLAQLGKRVNSESIPSYINFTSKIYNSYMQGILEEKENPRNHGIDSWLDL